jgi:hypothetical protein
MATYYWRGLSNANWGTAGNWSTGSTSTLGGAVPTNVDDAIFDANSSACTINITTAVCRFVNFSAYTNTITFSNNLSIGVNGGSNAGVALGASMGISGTGALNLQTANATLTGNGRIWPNLLQLGTNVANSATAVSLLDTWIQYGNLNLSPVALRYNVSGTGRIDFYGTSLFTQGQFNVAGGSPKLVILSACTFEGTQPASGVLGIPIDFSAGTNVVTLGNLRITSGRWTYYSGIVTGATGTFVSVVGSVGNFDASGIIFNDLYIPQGTPASTHTTTLFSDLNVRGDFYSNGGLRNIIISGGTSTSINLSGSCYLGGVTSGSFGTNGPTIRFKGPGTLVPPSESGGGNFPSNISIENGANTLSIVGNIAYYQGGTLPRPTFTYTSGILDLSSHSYIIVQNGFLNLNGITMKQVIFVQNLTTTLISRLSAETIVFSVGGPLTIDGGGGFTTGSLSYIQSLNQTVTLQNSVEYVINNSLLIRGTNAVNARLSSNSATLRTIFTLNPSATQDVGFVTTTRLDSSSGQTIYTRYGTLTNTLNWQLLTNPVTKSTSFIL